MGMKSSHASIHTTAQGAIICLLVLTLGACEKPADFGRTIPVVELSLRISAGTAPVILDVRSADEHRSGHIPGSVNLPHDQLPERLPELGLDRSEEIIVHCQSGRRAAIAEQVLAEAGYTNVRDLDGHMAGWRQAGLPTE
jgi:rhodanese-related sulfurtransferase